MITDLPRKRIYALSQWQTFLRFLPTRWRQKSTGIDAERNYVNITLCTSIGLRCHNLNLSSPTGPRNATCKTAAAVGGPVRSKYAIVWGWAFHRRWSRVECHRRQAGDTVISAPVSRLAQSLPSRRHNEQHRCVDGTKTCAVRRRNAEPV